jgi:hypothetical protein
VRIVSVLGQESAASAYSTTQAVERQRDIDSRACSSGISPDRRVTSFIATLCDSWFSQETPEIACLHLRKVLAKCQLNVADKTR